MKTKTTSSKSTKPSSSEHSLRLPGLSIPVCLGLFTLVYFLLEWGLKL